MDDNLRRLIAFVCGCYVNKTLNNNQYVPTRIYDCETNEYIPMNIQFNDYGFNLYDYGRCSYANGNGKYIYDFATQQTVCCVYNNICFNGFVADTSFQGIANGFNVSITDFENKKYFNYKIS